MSVAAVVTAAGLGTRLGSSTPKALVSLRGRPLLAWALDGVATVADVVVVTATPTHVEDFTRVAADAMNSHPHARVYVVPGGSTRQGSVQAALDYVCGLSDFTATSVLIHDAARAFQPAATMRGALAALADGADGAVPVVELVDTLVAAPGPDALMGANVNREGLRAVQTPQAFSLDAIVDAHRRAVADGFTDATDDATLAARYGYRVVAVDGHSWGFKVTREADLDWAAVIADRITDKEAP